MNKRTHAYYQTFPERSTNYLNVLTGLFYNAEDFSNCSVVIFNQGNMPTNKL